MGEKRKELETGEGMTSACMNTLLANLQTRAWAQAGARSLRDFDPAKRVSATSLAKAASGNGRKCQTTQWSQWLQGRRAVMKTTVKKIDERAAIFAGLDRVHGTGPWQASPVTGVGAHVPLWEVVRGNPGSILKAWSEVPKDVWRHWLPWMGDTQDPMTKIYPDKDYLQVEFTWQARAAKVRREKLALWREACREALRRFSAGETEVAEDDDNPNWEPPLVRTANELEAEVRKLGFDFSQDPWAEELLWLRQVEDFLRGKRWKMWGGHADEKGFRDRVGWFWSSGDDSYLDKWQPKDSAFRTEVSLCELLRECLASGMTFSGEEVRLLCPPLVILAASITVAKLTCWTELAADQLPRQRPYRIGFVREATGWNLDEQFREVVAAELERVGLSMELFCEAAGEFGIELYTFGTDEEREEEAREYLWIQEEQERRQSLPTPRTLRKT